MVAVEAYAAADVASLLVLLSSVVVVVGSGAAIAVVLGFKIRSLAVASSIAVVVFFIVLVSKNVLKFIQLLLNLKISIVKK